MIRFKHISAFTLVATLALAGCESMSKGSPELNERASELGARTKQKYEDMRHDSSETSGTDAAGTASQPTETMTHDQGVAGQVPHEHGVPGQATTPATDGVVTDGAATEESTWDRARRKAGETYDSVKQKMQ